MWLARGGFVLSAKPMVRWDGNHSHKSICVFSNWLCFAEYAFPIIAPRSIDLRIHEWTRNFPRPEVIVITPGRPAGVDVRARSILYPYDPEKSGTSCINLVGSAEIPEPTGKTCASNMAFGQNETWPDLESAWLCL
jgi:hypothetical protein